MLNKDRLEHPHRYEVTVFDTATEKIVLESQCFGVVVGAIKEVELTGKGEDIDGFYYSSSPTGINAAPQDVATLIYALADMYPEAKEMVEELMNGTVAVELIPESEDNEDDQESYD